MDKKKLLELAGKILVAGATNNDAELNTASEELAAAMKQLPVQSVELEPGSDNEADDTIMDFLDNFL